MDVLLGDIAAKDYGSRVRVEQLLAARWAGNPVLHREVLGPVTG